jgi:hypothetical protein
LKCDSCGKDMSDHTETKYKECTVTHCPETDLQRDTRLFWETVKKDVRELVEIGLLKLK